MTEFSENIKRIYGEKGKLWLNDLPIITARLSKLWNLTDLTVHANLSYNYVLDGLQNNHAIILKVGIDQPAMQREFAALTAFQGHGVVQLLDADLSQGALLLERAIPGTTLRHLFPQKDSLAIGIACRMIERMHRAPIPINNKFPTLAEWLQILDQDWDLPKQQLLMARTLKNKLLQATGNNVLLHGDLHYDNILSNGADWVVIDPKGVVGNPIYDKIGCLLREPLAELLQMSNLSTSLNARVQHISQYFNLDTKAILDWTYVQTVMAVCWCLEDNQDPSDMLKFLEIVAVVRAV